MDSIGISGLWTFSIAHPLNEIREEKEYFFDLSLIWEKIKRFKESKIKLGEDERIREEIALHIYHHNLVPIYKTTGGRRQSRVFFAHL